MKDIQDEAFVRRPVPAAVGAVFRDGKVLLIKRANPPDAGKWGLPGGKVEWGEEVLKGAERELFEETGVTVRAVKVFTTVDCIQRDSDGATFYHSILVAVLCDFISGEPVAGDDALDARWFSPEELAKAELCLSQDVLRVTEMARRLS